jgi:hypothetical protein
MSNIRLMQRLMCFSITFGNLAACPVFAEQPARIELCLDTPAISQLTHGLMVSHEKHTLGVGPTYKI